VCVPFASSLVGSHEASHDGPSTLRRQARSYTTRRDVTLAEWLVRNRGNERRPQARGAAHVRPDAAWFIAWQKSSTEPSEAARLIDCVGLA